MREPDDIAAELPPQRSDEPASLRQDILDELQDHLQSSFQFEQVSGRNEDDARESVLARFGNPATFARQLWWDAMREKIMSQRITLVLVAVLCCTSIAATVFAWKAIQQGQEVTAALVTEIKKLSDRPDPVIAPETKVDDRIKYLDWVPVKVKLVGEDGLPIADKEYEVRLSGNLLQEGEKANTSIQERPDQNGLIDFGFVKPGQITLNLTTPWYERESISQLVRPGMPVELTITCPREEIPFVETKLSVDWPEQVKAENVWTFLELKSLDRELAKQTWSRALDSPSHKRFISQHELTIFPEQVSPYDVQPQQDSIAHHFALLIDPKGKIYKTQWEIVPAQSDADSKRGNRRQSQRETNLYYYSPALLNSAFANPNSSEETSGGLYEKMMGGRPGFGASPGMMAPGFGDGPGSGLGRIIDSQTLSATLDEPLTEIKLPANGVQILAMRVVQSLPAEENSDRKFKTVLPVLFVNETPLLTPEGNSQRLVYQPDAQIVSLVEKRFAQLQAAEEAETESSPDEKQPQEN